LRPIAFHVGNGTFYADALGDLTSRPVLVGGTFWIALAFV
jgi:hypothetical protein